jgi:hypothetical protein
MRSDRDAYRTQRHNARNRGIPFLLTFEQWLTIWQDSGKLAQRGRGVGKFCMSRRGDAGAYEVGNVFIQAHTANSREGCHAGNDSKALPVGVQLKYPGGANPYRATAGARVLGHFSTAADAEAARAAHYAAHPKRIRTGRGFSFKAGKFETTYRHRYVGRFDTEEEAGAAYEAALAGDFGSPAAAAAFIARRHATTPDPEASHAPV